jgi:nucleoside-diphosphate-sugar epimerase
MAPYLMEAGYDVVGLDTGYFEECTLVPDITPANELRKDIRDLTPGDVRGFYAVIHLAALSNDAVGDLDPGWTDEINHRATVRLAELARDADVRRFLFSSSCIMYGMATAEVVDERSPLDPKTDYARSKVESERAIRGMATDRFSPTVLRNGTVYGLSPRMRFDTVLNNLVGTAYTTGNVVVFGDGKPWRPVVHVEDVARSFKTVLEAPLATVRNEIFNNGADHLNHPVIELAEIASSVVPNCAIEVRAEPDADHRTYRADFSKFARTFPEFEFKWSATAGAQQLVHAFDEIGLTADDVADRRFTRMRWLSDLVDTGRLDRRLRWTAEERDRDRGSQDHSFASDRG